MRVEEIITKDEIETPRSFEGYVTWFEQKIQRINATSDPELRKQSLCAIGIFKWFYEEGWPIYELLKKKQNEWDVTVIRCLVGNQSYDAEITVPECTPDGIPRWIEVTQVIDGRDNNIRMNVLAEKREVSLTGPAYKTKDGKFSVIPEAEAVDVKVTEIACELKKRIDCKTSKVYPPNTALLIYVDDIGRFESDRHFARLKSVVEYSRPQWAKVFMKVHLITSQGKAFAEF